MDGTDVRRFSVSTAGGIRVQHSLSYEEHEAARFAGIPWCSWPGMEMPDKAGVIAHYRLSQMVERVAENKRATRAKMKAPSSRQR